jgi:hypothetical protein
VKAGAPKRAVGKGGDELDKWRFGTAKGLAEIPVAPERFRAQVGN